jgi:acetylglutamate kinase
MQEKIDTVRTLIDAFPFIQGFRDQLIVIKYGGAAQVDPKLKAKFARDIAFLFLLGIKPVIVHGGGRKINETLEKLDIETSFVEGQRVTNREDMEVVEMVLSGAVNKEITSMLNHFGAKSIGISGKDANFMYARPKERARFGYTGTITEIKAKILLDLVEEKFIPVIAPIAASEKLGEPGYNINADLAASRIAGEIGAKKVLFLTDTPGVLDREKKLLRTLTENQVEALKTDGTIQGGMIPKVDACLEAIDTGVEKAHIIDGRIEHAILLELFTSEGIGTVIKKEQK